MRSSRFESLEKAEEAIKGFAVQNGHAVNRARSKKNKAGTEIRKLWLKCIHGRVQKDEGSGIRLTSTKKTDCKWQATVQQTMSGDSYSWNIKVVVGERSGHDPVDETSMYATNRILKPNQALQVSKMTKAAATPAATNLTAGNRCHLTSRTSSTSRPRR